ncbi:hypothetical protein L227DRAFT_223973 [Lentinus tigrinus ALCF2SS1-6]|uniref:Uncharacterized protein n=1 Tax=Lentinus tigrinus ALCF2SS1-6 TaxID=1328759 RepID=A0A5C2S2Z5_9APHY|nr:hypothetical protein L227DRAFT_223973 [Lentinus tigrinus ALCF2SS1-6]
MRQFKFILTVATTPASLNRSAALPSAISVPPPPPLHFFRLPANPASVYEEITGKVLSLVSLRWRLAKSRTGLRRRGTRRHAFDPAVRTPGATASRVVSTTTRLALAHASHC